MKKSDSLIYQVQEILLPVWLKVQISEKKEQGLVGGLFNIKGADKIRAVQKVAVENSRLKIPLIFGMDVIHGYETLSRFH
jgi:beta-glucosidase-like glycosyl hydrolase